MKGFFITGTDTGVGKTTFAFRLIADLQEHGHSVSAFKPVACGGIETPEGFYNEDVLAMQAQLTTPMTHDQINPIFFEQPIAPSIAALEAGVTVTVEALKQAYLKLQGDYVVVEGAGGWAVPLNEKESMADVAVAIGLPVILVVAIKLGCLNHALLTAKSIQDSGLEFAGWIANVMDEGMNRRDENIAALSERLGEPRKVMRGVFAEPSE